MSHGQTALDARAAEPTPGAARRIVLVVGWLCAVGLAVLVLHLLGVDVEGWFSSLWDALTAVDPVDVLAGLGPAPVRAGAVVEAGVAASAIPVVDAFPWTVPPALHDVAITAGPRADWFAADAWTTLLGAPWTASGDVDRVGVRLDGPALDRIRLDELPSEGMRPGAIQVPPHGRPVVLLADGPVTGGYPVIAVVTDAALDALAQVRPGDRVRFRRV